MSEYVFTHYIFFCNIQLISITLLNADIDIFFKGGPYNMLW